MRAWTAVLACAERLAQFARHARCFRHHEGDVAVRRQEARAFADEFHLAREVAVAAYAPPPPPSDSLIAPPPRDFVDTDYAARLDRASGAINITAPPSGIMAVGGYRFLAQDLQEWARRLGQGALLTALPDRLSGHRLAGRALDNARAREALTELGLNPLMVEAFRDRANTA